MDPPAFTFLSFIFILGNIIVGSVHAQMCPHEQLEQCLQLADPFIQDPKFVFPVSMLEIQTMCGAWNRFTDCVRSYVSRCLIPEKRQEFDRSVQESEEMMQQMCGEPRYQAEYLQNANCIKDVSVNPDRCGVRYSKLVGEVATQLNQEALCCHFGKFRSCVLTLTTSECSPSASDFAHHMLDKAMGFLLRSCQDTLQTDPADECPPGSRDDAFPSNTLGPILSQSGTGQLPTVVPPVFTSKPSIQWTYDPQNGNGIAPESLQGPGNGSLAITPFPISFITSLLLFFGWWKTLR